MSQQRVQMISPGELRLDLTHLSSRLLSAPCPALLASTPVRKFQAPHHLHKRQSIRLRESLAGGCFGLVIRCRRIAVGTRVFATELFTSDQLQFIVTLLDLSPTTFAPSHPSPRSHVEPAGGECISSLVLSEIQRELISAHLPLIYLPNLHVIVLGVLI